MNLSVTSSNVRSGFFQNQKPDLINQQFKTQDIWCLQETRTTSTRECERTLDKLHLRGVFDFAPDGNRLGVAVLVTASTRLLSVWKSGTGRLAYAIIEKASFRKEPFAVFSVYMPVQTGSSARDSANHDEIYTLLSTKIEELRQQDIHFIIVAGDFNSILNPEIDAESPTVRFNQHIKEMHDNFCTRHLLEDAYRYKYPELKSYTFKSTGQRSGLWKRRLDRILIPSVFAEGNFTVEHLPVHFSDHRCVQIELKIPKTRYNTLPNVRPIWRHNDLLFEEESYNQQIATFIRTTISRVTEANPKEEWDWFKTNLRIKCQKEERKIMGARTRKRKKLIKDLRLLGQDDDAREEAILEALERIDNETVRTLAFKAGEKHFEYGEKSSAFLHAAVRLEKTKL